MATARLTKIFHISPPVHNPQSRQEAQPSPTKSSFKLDRNTIGLAISRPRSEAIFKNSPVVRPQPALQRQPSRLLPPKPTRPPRPNLTLNIPSRKPVAPASAQPPPTDRTSTMTNVTGFADLDMEAPESAQIWRPPPSDPQSATTYYVADKWGNWVLKPAELDTYTPLTKSPIEKREEEAKAMAVAISAAALMPEKRRSRRTSRPGQGSADNNASRRVPSYYLQGSPAAGRSLTRPSGPSGTGTADSVNRKRMERGNSKDSRGSATTMDTSSSYGPYDEDSPVEPEVGRLSSLSPVVESPSPTTGRSPVRYPKIHGRLDGATIRFAAEPNARRRASRPKLAVRLSSSPEPAAPLAAAATARRIGAVSSGVNVRLGVLPQPKPKPQPFPTFPVPPLNINRPRSTPGGPRPGKAGQNPPRLDTRQPPLRPQHISSFVSPVSAATTMSSATSSLLAKRLGNEKAAALSLDNGPHRKPGGPWKRQRGGGPNDPGLLSPDMASMSTPRTRLPATPTWQPRLTPTRRGDDLFLNVQ
ncbi:Def1-like protein [Apiospora phragmitis]|uniref:Def1-like protein n=1 Tax=Apiospora phragmitis TaxID=2905665 RepID=A0ABR1TQI2_9PEZI